MKRNANKIVATMLMICLVVTLLLPAVALKSSAASEAKRFNIMMVIDGSGSLETADRTDPDRMRYELIYDLLGILENDGHNIGAVVFSGNTNTSAADADMERGIMLNTGMISLDGSSPDGRPVKEYIYEQIKDTGYDHTRNGTTDIGTALLVAERELQKTQQQNGLESLVFLFTDGVSYLKTSEQQQKSKDNMNLATKEMSDNGIRLMGAFLNKDGKLDSSEITGIVCAANGITETSQEFLISYAEINNAASCHDAVNTILKFLGYIPLDVDPEIKYGSFTDTFTVPGIGVEEMNIRLYSAKGESLPDMTVELTQPDGTVLKGTTLNALSRKSRTFQIYKLEEPMVGQWTLSVTIPEGNKIGYIYSPIVSMYVDSEIRSTPDAASIHGNMDVTFTGLLSQNGTAITDPASYREYACTLKIKNLIDGSEESIDIPNNNNAKFEHTMKWTKTGQFEAQIIFHCDEIQVISPVLSFTVVNNPPTTDGTVKINLTYGLFQKNSKTVDLTKYFSDVEDGTNLTVSLQNTSCSSDAYTLNGSQLELQSKKIKDDTMELVVQDSAGETATLTLKLDSKNVTLWFIILFIVIIIAIIVVILVKKMSDNSVVARGDLNASFEIEVNNRGVLVPLALDVPGTSAPSKTTLKKLLAKTLGDDALRLDCGVAPSDVRNALRNIWDDLDEVVLYKAIKKNGKKKKEGAIGIKYGKKQKVLYDSAYTFTVERQEFTIEFVIERDDDDFFGNDTFGGGGNDSNDFDDLFG